MQTQGESFYAALDSGGSINKPILTEYMVNGEIEIKAVRKDGFLFARNMETGETELYNLCEDPQALNDISGTLPEIEDELSGELDTLISENRELRLNFEYDKELALPKERVDNMRALGYMGN